MSDIMTPIEMRIIDKSLPSDGRTRLLEVSAHDDIETIPIAISDIDEPPSILECRLTIME
jgi:hypothetical protein